MVNASLLKLFELILNKLLYSCACIYYVYIHIQYTCYYEKNVASQLSPQLIDTKTGCTVTHYWYQRPKERSTS